MTATYPDKSAADFPREVLELFDQFVHGDIDRRAFVERSAAYATAGLTGAGFLAALTPDFANAQMVSPRDTRIATQMVDIPSPQGNGTIQALIARPVAAKGKLPVVIVAHENRGLNPHIEDIARRMAVDNFIAVAPDALTSLGGYPGDEDKAREMFAKLDQPKVRNDFIAASRYALGLTGGSGRLGAVGFCFGGGIVNMLATRVPELRAAVPFYGPAPDLALVKDIKAELLIHFAANDERVNATWPPYETALKTAKVKYQAFTYAGTEHGFNNNTTPRFHPEAAKLAWTRTLALFARTLKG
ncbi:dienelactone hydrolase family protein [Sphingobium subterraneum]|uniref:Carboxymethylenebutenolidase n=1 Tax=Sphingobium subterraneum TaxID=627688 RepID=A0A841IXZ5_9SPHN|nr:dienelactone hydrolase family protein [Sphingobium subterraneum]MBB6123533.1 carboxymethylenebutenolidase [Sphingobium subterraneum]